MTTRPSTARPSTVWPSTLRPTTRRSAAMAVAVVAVLAWGVILLAATSARAGTWMQISCVNPDGSAAPAEGWTLSTSSPPDPGGIANTQCSPRTPMLAELSVLAGAPPNSAEYLSYQPPAGSTLLGGSLNVTMSADGYGNASGGSAVAEAGLYEPSLATPFFRCVAFFQTCGPSPNFSGVVNLPNDAQGTLTAGAGCCLEHRHVLRCQCQQQRMGSDAGGVGTPAALIQRVADGIGFQRQRAAARSPWHGTRRPQRRRDGRSRGSTRTRSRLTARRCSAGTPNTNGGKCVPVGTDAASGALMFDYSTAVSHHVRSSTPPFPPRTSPTGATICRSR